MKKLTAIAATLVMLLVTSTADAGILYGNSLADGFTRAPIIGGVFRAVGNMERRKDTWLFGAPIGITPRYQYQGGYYDQQPYYQAPVQKSVPPKPATKK